MSEMDVLERLERIEHRLDKLLALLERKSDKGTEAQVFAFTESRHLKEASWHHGQLRILFHNGTDYFYVGVPETIFQDLIAAPSAGMYFHSHIKDVFPCQKVQTQNQSSESSTTTASTSSLT